QMNSAHRRRRAIARGLMVSVFTAVAVVASASAYALYRRLMEPRPTAGGLPAASSSSNPALPDFSSGQSTGQRSPDERGPRGSPAEVKHSDPPAASTAPPVRSSASAVRRPRSDFRDDVKPIKYMVQFRPYAYAQVDDKERQPENRQHEFTLRPGRHTLVYGC